MKQQTLEAWEKKYIPNGVEPFDQSREMYKRVIWEPELKELKRKTFGLTMPKDRPGYRLAEMHLAYASWYLEMAFAQGVVGGKMGLYDWNARPIGTRIPPKDLKLDFKNPQQATRDIKKVSTFFGADLVGICELDRRWLYSHSFHMLTKEHEPIEIPAEYKYAVVMAYEMDYDLEKFAPAQLANAAIGMGYTRMAFTSGLVAQFIRGLGYKAIPCGNDTARSIPFAMLAGVGELGRNGILITPQFGPRVRLSKIFTDLPLVPDKPIEFGVTEFCNKCMKCAEACPSKAISYGEPNTKPYNMSNANLEVKWRINAEKCLAYFGANGADCSACIRACPFNKHMNWFHKTSLWLVDHARFGDAYYRKMDDLLGYGKQEEADNFWVEWQPRTFGRSK